MCSIIFYNTHFVYIFHLQMPMCKICHEPKANIRQHLEKYHCITDPVVRSIITVADPASRLPQQRQEIRKQPRRGNPIVKRYAEDPDFDRKLNRYA